MKPFILITLVLFSCGENKKPQAIHTETPEKNVPTPVDAVQGDFNGDGRQESVYPVIVTKGKENPQDGGTEDDYAVRFSDTALPAFGVGCCEVHVYNEGNLDGLPGDELSVLQEPSNGCTWRMQTWTFNNSTWKPVFDFFLVPTACETVTDSVVQQWVFAEKGEIWYFEADPNEPGQFNRHRAVLK